jgi:signal transduction histidine kinase
VLQERFNIREVVSLPIRGATFSGRLFMLDKRRPSRDDFVLATAVAHHVTAGLEHMYFAEQLRTTAAMQERGRLAQDLHDGFLQSLTAIDLRLETVAHSDNLSPTVRGEIEELQSLVTTEYDELRRFVRSLPWKTDDVAQEFDLAHQLGDLPARLERHWNVSVKASIEVPSHGVTPEFARGVYFLIREAAVNAARHAGATEIAIVVASHAAQLVITIFDNGRGLDFEGRYDQDELAALGLGPGSLRARVALLNGRMILETNRSGTRLEFTLPVSGA